MALILSVRKNLSGKKASEFSKRSIKKTKPTKKIKVGSIVFFRNRLWKFVGKLKDKCKLELLPDEKPVRFQNGYVTKTNAYMESLFLVDEPSDYDKSSSENK